MPISAIFFCHVTVEGRAAITYGIRMHALATYRESPMTASGQAVRHGHGPQLADCCPMDEDGRRTHPFDPRRGDEDWMST
jgi:hypothetical protein